MVLLRLEPASSKWYNIGLGLNLDVGTLENIKHSNNNQNLACLRECIRHYLQRTIAPHWDNIVKALKQRSVGYYALAEEIEEEIGELRVFT